MRIKYEKSAGQHLIRMFHNYSEVAYCVLGISGLQAEIELPTVWHERKAAWVRIGLGFCSIAFSFPWRKAYPDFMQCSGPTFGFHFYEDLFWLRWGQDTGHSKDPRKSLAIYMPWHWSKHKNETLSEPETHPYTYVLRSGDVQNREATIYSSRSTWWRYWLPFRKVRTYINVRFNDEVGERSGSWKGGVLGCGYEMKRGETPLDTLRRMERERKF